MRFPNGPQTELLDAAGRHAAAHVLNRPLLPSEGVPWTSLMAHTLTHPVNYLLVPDLSTGLQFMSRSDVRLMDQDGVTIPARAEEYDSKVRAVWGNGSIRSIFARASLPKYMDMQGLESLHSAKNGTLDVAVSTSSPRLPRQGSLKKILTEMGFNEVLFGFERGRPNILESSLGQYLLGLIGKFIANIDRDMLELSTVFDIMHPIPAMSSTDPTGGDGLFARQVGDWMRVLSGKQVRTNLVMINPLLSEPLMLDPFKSALRPAEI